MSAGNILDTDAIASGTTLPTIRSSHAEIRRGRSGSRLSHPGSVAPKDLTVSGLRAHQIPRPAAASVERERRHEALPGTVPLSCQMLRRRGVRFGLAHLRPGQFADRVGEAALPHVGRMQVDHRGAAARMAHPVHQLPKVRARVGREHVSRVAKIVEVNAGHADPLQCLDPNSAVEVAVP